VAYDIVNTSRQKGQIVQLLNEGLVTSATLIGYLENGSEAWHSARNEPGAIGGSEIGAIMGWNQWESAITKWAKKTGKIDDRLEPSHRMRFGTKFEEPILEIFQEDHPELAEPEVPAPPTESPEATFVFTFSGDCLSRWQYMK